MFGHTDVVVRLVIPSQTMCKTMVHHRMIAHFAPNDQEERVISESPNVGMNLKSKP